MFCQISPLSPPLSITKKFQTNTEYEHPEARFITVTYHIKALSLFAIGWFCHENWGPINNATFRKSPPFSIQENPSRNPDISRKKRTASNSLNVYFKGSCLMSFERVFKRCKYMSLELSSHPRSLIMIATIIYCLAKIFTDSSDQLFETRQFHVSCNAILGMWRPAICVGKYYSFSFSLYNLAFYAVFRRRAIAYIKEANLIIQITQI